MKEETKEIFKDYYFYINQDLVLTKEEKNRALPRVDYNEYLKVFYKKRINFIFKNYKDIAWFKQRYCEKRNDFKERFFNFLSKKEELFYKNNILVKEINENLPDKEVKEVCEKCLNFQEFNLFLSLKDKILVRNGIISVKSDLNESLNFMNSFAQQSNLKFEPIILEENIKKSNLKTKDDLKNVKLILKIFSDFYNLSEEIIEGVSFFNFLEKIAKESQNELYFYITFLRKVFLFCYYCVKQFDSFMEMNLKCGKDHIFSEESLVNTNEQNIFERSISIFHLFENFNKIATDFTSDFIENDIDEFVEKKDIEVYGCKLCSKEFSGLNFVRTHISKKHPDSMKDIKLELEFYKNLLANLDFRLFSRLSGIDLFVLPEFIKNIMAVNRVMYSERVFSGEIKVKK